MAESTIVAMQEQREKDDRSLRDAVVGLLAHVLIGSTVFSVIAMLAVLLDWALLWLETQGTSTFIVSGLRSVEILLFAADLGLFVVFIGNVAWIFWRKLRWL